MQGGMKNQTAPLYDAIFRACRRIATTDGRYPQVRMANTSYVLDGRSYTLVNGGKEYTFWLGLNGPHLFFITYVNGVAQEQADAVFSGCFNAGKAGWQPNYEPLDNGVSIWASCVADRARLLCPAMGDSGKLLLSAAGAGWANHVAMTVQAWIHTCERLNIRCQELEVAAA